MPEKLDKEQLVRQLIDHLCSATDLLREIDSDIALAHADDLVAMRGTWIRHGADLATDRRHLGGLTDGEH